MTADHDEKAKLGSPGMPVGAPVGASPTPAVGGAAATAAAPPAHASINDFGKLQFRIATVVECRPHANADKLLVLQIDLGGERRQICAGIRQHYQPEQLVGKQILVVANLEPRPLRGEVSQGMLLAATDAATGKVVILSPAEPVAAGSSVK
jgi:methionine--tRNA ligase beta chain